MVIRRWYDEIIIIKWKMFHFV